MFSNLNQTSSYLLFSRDAQTRFTVTLAALLAGVIAGFILVAVLPGLHTLIRASLGFCLLYLISVVVLYIHAMKNTSSALCLLIPSMIFASGVILSLLQFS